MLSLTFMNIPDHWIVDMQVARPHVHMELCPSADTPAVGTVLVTASYGRWETVEVLRPSTPQRGAVVVVRLIGVVSA
jgi:hypothetical protein